MRLLYRARIERRQRGIGVRWLRQRHLGVQPRHLGHLRQHTVAGSADVHIDCPHREENRRKREENRREENRKKWRDRIKEQRECEERGQMGEMTCLEGRLASHQRQRQTRTTYTHISLFRSHSFSLSLTLSPSLSLSLSTISRPHSISTSKD